MGLLSNKKQDELADVLLDIEGIKTDFRNSDKKDIRVLDGVSIQLKRGEIIGLVGESGSGKSITMLSSLQLLPGNGKVKEGTVIIDDNGKNLLENKPDSNAMRQVRGGRIGMIFQEPMTSLNPVMPVGEQIRESISEHLHLSRAEGKARAIEMMEMVKIPDAAERYNEYPMQFSGGMRQRIMIAMVLAAQPDVLIADEATTALDVTTQALLLEMIKDLSVTTGISVVIVTHNLGIVARYAERIYVMYAGNIVEYGDAESIFHRSYHPYTKSLLKAIPRLDDPIDRVLVPIEGLPPSPANRPTYCAFYPRCQFRDEKCKELPKPELSKLPEGEEHYTACHLSMQEFIDKVRKFDVAQSATRPPKNIQDEVCIELNNITKSFTLYKGLMKKKVAEFNAIEDISFSVRKGETLGIVGESGCGKTTLARTIMRMYEPDAGEIKIFGTDIAKMKAKELVPFRKNMAMVFQDPSSSLDPRKTAGDSVAEPMIIHNIYDNPAEMSDRVDELFTLVGLDPLMRDRFPHSFSGGQRQRIGVARALASDPAILLLDEPISALDVSIQAQVINLLEDLQSRMGLAYLFIAHDLAVVKHISDRILVMYLGRVMEVASSEDLYANPIHPYTQALLSAVPIADPVIEKKRTFIELQGEVPSVINRAKGCPFSGRCVYATDQCKVECPSATDRGGGHMVACFNK